MISRIMILMLAGLFSAPAGAVEIEGVKLADTATVAGRDLVLNGAGLRKKLIVDVYVASLYLPEKVSAAAAVLKAEPRRVEVRMLREVGAVDFLEAIKDGIEANTSQTERDAIQPQVSEFEAVITAIGETKEGDTIMLDFVGGNTLVTINGVEKTRIAGEGFNRALLKVWLGDHPAQADLKKAMLGG
ncbi:MAG: chalcone isomerase family protein [Gammaproteobacteria bacterium]